MRKLYQLCAGIGIVLWTALQAGAQTITVGSLTPTGPFCSAASSTLAYTTSALFAATQTFTAELSDASGNFPGTTIGSTTGTTSGNISVTFPTVGASSALYVIRITATPDNVTSAAGSAFTISPIPAPTLAQAPPGNVCSGTAVTYTTESGKSSYAWTFSGTVNTDYTLAAGTGTPTSNMAVVTWITTGNKSVSINYSNGACTAGSPTSVATTVIAPPTPTFTTPASANACVGAAVTYTTQASQTNYAWTFTGTAGVDYTLLAGTGTPTSNIATVTWLTPGNKVVTTNYSNGTCAAVTPANFATNVSVVPVPTFTTPAVAGTICQGATVTYITQAGQNNYVWVIPGTPVIDYVLAVGTGTPTSNIATITWVSAGSKTVSVNYTNAGGCTGASPASITKTVTSNPTVSFTTQPGATVCVNNAVTYTTQSGGGITTYVWSFPGVLNTDYTLLAGTGTPTSNTAIVTYLTTGSKTVSVNYTDANSCTGTSSATNTTTVNPSVGSTSFTVPAGSNLRCQGAGNVTYTATASNTTGITYTLVTVPNDPTTTIVAGTGQVSYSAGFSGTATITASSAGCNGPTTANFAVTVTPTVGTPVFTAGPLTSRCQGAATITYAATATNNTGITYSLVTAPNDPTTTINAGSGAVSYSATFAGTATITASAAGCNGPKTATFVVSTVGNPVFVLGSTSSRCQGFANITYTANSVNNTGLSYAFTGTGASVTNTSTGQIIYDPAVNNTVSITVTASGCPTPLTATHTVTIKSNVAAPVFILPALTPCQGSTVTYTATAANSDSVRYGIVTTPANGATTNIVSGSTVYNPPFVGSAIVTATGFGCGPTQSTSINVVVQPVVTQPQFNSGPLATICQAANPTTVTYTATASNASSLVYSLSPGIAATSFNTNTGQLTYSSTFTGTATITATATGCNGNSSNTFTVNVVPTVSAPIFTPGNPTTRKQGVSTVTYGATANNSTAITYSLDPASVTAGNVINPSTGAVTYAANFSGITTITATATGCNASPTATFTVTTVKTPVFALGASSTRCEATGTITYTATSNFGTVTYYLTTNPANPATTINPATGLVSYDSTFFGIATVSAVSTFNSIVTDTARHTVTVNVAPRLTSPTPTSKVICSGDNTLIPLVATTGAGSLFAWTLLGGANISNQSGGSGTSINQALTDNSNANPDSLYYIVTVTSPAPASCLSIIKDTIKVRVNPKPVLTTIAPVTICSESSINISLGASAPSTFIWGVTAPAKITNASPGSGAVINQTLNNTDVTLPPGVPSSGTATYTITPTSLAGCQGNSGTALVTVNPLPVVVFTTGTSKTICSGQPTAIPLSANLSSSFAFSSASITSLALISGQQPTGSGNTINQTLSNSSNLLADSIAYSVIPTTISGSPTCIGKPSTVVVRVNPKPAITAPITDTVCSGLTTKTQLAATISSTYAWSIGTVTGSITGQSANPTSSAVSVIGQQLINPADDTAGSVEYIVIPTSSSLPNCVGAAKTITVKVNPSPRLTSAPTRSLCSGDILTYLPTSSVTTGTTIFSYIRTSPVPSIKDKLPQTTTGISDTLFTDFILSPAVVNYNFTLTSAAGCFRGNQQLNVTVNPRPDTPGISIFPRTKLCSGATSMNFSTSRVPDPREFFRWSTSNAGIPIQKADSTFSQNSLISFPNAGNAVVTVESISRGFGCVSKPTNKQMPVSSAGGSQGINVVLFANNLVAQVTGAKAYQWGFDRKSDLDSTMLNGETTQSYDTRRGFNTATNYYWVMATFQDDCVQKAYFNGVTLGVPAQQAQTAEVRVYPNPVQDVVTLELMQANTADLTYEVYDLTGKRVTRMTSSSAKTRIPVGELAPGYYTVTCMQAGLRIATSRFIKN